MGNIRTHTAQKCLMDLIGVWPIDTYSLTLHTMRPYASVLHWCTCKVVFRQVSYVCW